MKSSKKITTIIVLLVLILMAVTAPGKPSDFGKNDNPSFYKVRKFVICSICYVGYHTNPLGEALGIAEWRPCGFGILGMTFDINYRRE